MTEGYPAGSAAPLPRDQVYSQEHLGYSPEVLAAFHV